MDWLIPVVYGLTLGLCFSALLIGLARLVERKTAKPDRALQEIESLLEPGWEDAFRRGRTERAR